MSHRIQQPIFLSAVLSAALGALVACQSAPPTSKEPPPTASARPTSTGAPVSGTLQNQATPPPQGAAPTAAPSEPAAVQPAGSNMAAGHAAPAVPQAAAHQAAAAGPVADKPAAAKGADKGTPAKAAGDKAADAKVPAGKTVQGTVVSEEPFSVWLQATSPAKAGAPLQLEAVLVAKAPYHCNEEYPHKFKLNAAPAGLSYPEETVRGAKVTPERSVLAIPVNAQSAGKPTVAGTLSFSVCTEERCLVEKRDLSVALDVM